MRKTTAALALASISVLVVPTTAIASDHAQPPTKCKNDGHKYIQGKSAKVHGNKTTFVGTFRRFHPCGEDDRYFTGKKSITLTLTPASTIKVFKNQLAPSHYKTVTAAHFPHAFNKRSDEPNYQFSGPKSAVKKLKEHFVS